MKKINFDEMIKALDDYIAEQTAKGKDWRDRMFKTKAK